MAECEVKVEKEIKLILTSKEGLYLKGLLQNSLEKEEDPFHEKMRKNIFEALPDFRELA